MLPILDLKMNILVCIKQVPGTTQVEIDPATGTLKRDGVAAKMNPFDLYAIETALRLKKELGATVSVLTMGPPQAERAVREAFMMGVDNGYVLSDRKFGGADVLATSYTLSQGIKKIGNIDLVICGKQTTDGDTAQVGPELAERLGITHATGICSIESATDRDITVKIDQPGHTMTQRIPFPCLITVEKGIFEPRLPSYKLKMATADREVTWLKLDDLEDRDPSHYGLNGSPTQVKRIFPPENRVEHVEIKGNAAEQARQAVEMLAEGKFLQQDL